MMITAVGPLAAPLAADAQQPQAKVPRIGLLGDVPSLLGEPFRQGLRELGYIEGQNIVIEQGRPTGIWAPAWPGPAATSPGWPPKVSRVAVLQNPVTHRDTHAGVLRHAEGSALGLGVRLLALEARTPS